MILTPERPRPVAEVVRLHLVLALLLFIVGWAGQGALQGFLPSLGGDAGGDAVTVASTAEETAHILRNNTLFFLLVSVMPVVNVVLFAPQFLMVGSHGHTLAGMPASAQWELLYRHTALETVALMLSIAVSYLFFFAVRAYSLSPDGDKHLLAARIRRATALYPVILAVTLVAALLEGSAVVHV